ncbi:endonuclease NucS domain-containing protein [Thermosipho affectus]|uniref:endonuclease NucS domain-containing protein n=1 Tax=Thermosipho affectus TaxID=660294 RepID=UPI0018E9E7D6|nr:endonuclease NucS domain-containing protein [Thermosipho affectus]
MAGFTNSINGFWTYSDISIGDYISFLYGARIKDLYRVTKKVAYKNAENLPPWPSIKFRNSGNTYYFPFRLHLEKVRDLDEPLVKAEFAYVAENLLLRGGYKKTHFQADLTTLHNVSTMGRMNKIVPEPLEILSETFTPKIVFNKKTKKIPFEFPFHEFILQSLVRKKIKDFLLKEVLENFSKNLSVDDFEVLGEKALPEGFVDIFIKLKYPIATNRYVLVEIKTKRANTNDIEQLHNYLKQIGKEVIGGVLIAKDFPKAKILKSDIMYVKYCFKNLDVNNAYSFEELLKMLSFTII